MSLTVDQVLEQLGGFGLYQFILLSLIGYLQAGPGGGYQISIITFIAGEPSWECVVNSTVCNITGAVETTSRDYNARCSMPRSEWKFSDTYTSTVTEFDLVCERSYLQHTASSVFWLGWLLGNLLFGHIADKIGRRKVIITCALCICLISWIVVWPPYLSVYISCNILAGFFCAGLSMTGYVLLMEYNDVKHRSMTGTCIWCYSSASAMLIALLAYFIRDWRQLLLCGAVIASPAILIAFFCPESSRYLLTNHRHDDAMKELAKVAKWNKKTMPGTELQIPKDIPNEKFNIRDLFYNAQVAKITIASWIAWFSCALVFYILTYGSIYLGGSVYLNYFLVTLVKVPSLFTSLYCLNRFGRRKALVGSLAIAAVTSAIAVAIPNDRSNTGYTVGRVTMSMLCQYAITTSFATLYVYSTELFPTSVRAIGMGTSSACARIGSFLSLYVVWLIRIHVYLPYSIVIALCLLTGVVCFKCLPETREQPTPESMAFYGVNNIELKEPETQRASLIRDTA